MQEFDALLQVADRLLSPQGGCPWDQKQTFKSLQPFILEEAHEVIEAVDLDHDGKMCEELGDLLYVIIFYGKLGEKFHRFTMQQIINTVKEKLIRRHPHVFGGIKADTLEEIKENWERIKKEEKKEKGERPGLERLPATLPLLTKAQKILERLEREGSPLPVPEGKVLTEESVGKEILHLVELARREGIDAESVFRRELIHLEESSIPETSIE